MLVEAYAKPFCRRALGTIVNLARAGSVDYGFVSFRAKLGTGVGIAMGARVDWASSIGSYSFVGFDSFVTKASIGRYCSIGNRVAVGPGEHPSNHVSTSSRFYDDPYNDLTLKPCTIGNDVWIGSDSIIRRGVTVGNGAIVGANSFVREDVPEFAIVAGSPARILKLRFSEAQCSMIAASKWWGMEPGPARRLIEMLEAQGLGKPIEEGRKP